MQLKLLLKKLKPGKRVFLSMSLAIGFIFLAVGFVFLRHRQLCSYQQAISSGILQNANEQTLCPSILNPSNWQTIALNAVNLDFTSSLSTNVSSLFQLKASNTETCSDQLNPLCWLGDSKPALKQSDGFTNVLLVGLDTRGGRGLKNTDTIVVASLDHSSGKVILLSFPRDLYVKYKNPKGAVVSYKINGIYALNGIQGLNGAVSQIIGKPIHYYAYVNLSVFSDSITALGGIEVNLEKPFSDLFPCVELQEKRQGCKGKSGGFGRFQFPEGVNKFDAIDANVYARSRYASSDFDRARRQQNILSAILKRVVNQETPINERLSTYINLYNIFRSQVITDVEVQDIAGLFAIADQLNKNTLNITLDPNLDGGRIIKNSGIIAGVGYSIEFKDSNYRQFQNYISSIWDNLAFYSERPSILIVNATNTAISNETAIAKLIANPPAYAQIKVIDDANYKLQGTRIYSFSEKTSSLNQLTTLIPEALVFNPDLDNVLQTGHKEDLLVIVGKNTLVE